MAKTERRARRRRGARDYLRFAEALAAAAAASLMIRLLPFRTVGAYAARLPRRRRPADGAEVARLRAAVRGWGRRAPWRLVCFQQALALQMLLRRRGVASTLHYGIAREEELKAHVWLSVAGETVIGGEDAPRFTEIARFPPACGAK
jgi:hypothetical protein